jgi:hypothetical protein
METIELFILVIFSGIIIFSGCTSPNYNCNHNFTITGNIRETDGDTQNFTVTLNVTNLGPLMEKNIQIKHYSLCQIANGKCFQDILSDPVTFSNISNLDSQKSIIISKYCNNPLPNPLFYNLAPYYEINDSCVIT